MGQHRGLPSIPIQQFLPAERIAVDGSVSVVTSNASLSIEGHAEQPVVANAGRCNLRLPSADGWVPPQPCLITGSPPPAQTGDAAAALARQAGAFNQSCGVDREYNSESVCTCMRALVPGQRRAGARCTLAAAPHVLPGPPLRLTASAATDGTLECRANVTEFDATSQLDAAAAAAVPLPGPLAGEASAAGWAGRREVLPGWLKMLGLLLRATP